MSKIRQDVEIVANGVDIKQFTTNDLQLTKEGREKKILFIGDFKWVENKDAAEWAIKEIWPKLKAETIPSMTNGIKLWVVGKHIPQSIQKLGNDKSIIFDENASSKTEEIYKNANLLLAPIRVGGGTSFKVLEAMASGVPVITTSLGNAIEAQDNLEIIIANTTQEFIQGIKKLLDDEKLYEKISMNARKLVEEKYNWDKICRDLNLIYESLCN